MIGGEPVGACAVTAGQPESMPVSGNTLVKELYSSFVQLLQGCSGSPGLHPHQHTIIILPSTQNALVYKQSAQGLGGGSGPGVAPPDRARGSGLPDQDLNAESPYNRPSPMIGGESVGACAVTADNGTQIRQENEKLLKKLTCKICKERQVDTTLLPCGHLVICDRCASRLTIGQK
ncbi:uncharacterized protein LOC128237131 [Mya arenaria]|uniref:uncharacterized protein LOC128237131 n=1 Tax=Mya arenaria TaxID=6604 RepID=UPI0022E460F7|nr:uncharacterized protein LOC128237131 [Mya arenaria]XP_052808340.1 uncharacterized protein LOC128237131 [Mya arenaria]XP_052808341.1 uncharacterized protein LOC128237131 [Mya arenaria]